MYNSVEIAERIKFVAKSKSVPVKTILDNTGLGVNTLQHMNNSMPKVDTLARIADYLEVSIDYLLGRNSPETAEHTELMRRFDSLDNDSKEIIARLIVKLSEGK